MILSKVDCLVCTDINETWSTLMNKRLLKGIYKLTYRFQLKKNNLHVKIFKMLVLCLFIKITALTKYQTLYKIFDSFGATMPCTRKDSRNYVECFVKLIENP